VELGEQEALELAATMPVGRLAYASGDQIFIVPVNFMLDDRDVLVRTADGANLLDAARRNVSAAFEVDDLVNWSRSGWSVLIRGALSEETDSERVRRVLAYSVRPWAAGKRDRVVRLASAQVTGRRIEPGPGGVTFVDAGARPDG